MHQGNTTFNTEEIEIHIRTYRSLLKSSGLVKIENLIDSHIGMHSVLHEKAGKGEIDLAAFIYVLLRLPSNMSSVKTLILGQSYSVFTNNGYKSIKNWQEVDSPGRRRKMYHDGRETLAVYIASVTDVDDLITLLTAFQIEWNKFHKLLTHAKDVEKEAEKHLNHEDLLKIKNIWGEEYHKFLTAIKHRQVDFTIRLLSGSYVEYSKATQNWWSQILKNLKHLNIIHRPLYFVSSNTHSLTNVITRFVLSEEKTLIDLLYKSKNGNLIRLWEEIISGDFLATRENFLYYLAKKFAAINPRILAAKNNQEKKFGIHHVPASYFLDIDTQVIELSKLANANFDERLGISTKHLAESRALIINIDYPLGWAAYQILTEIGQYVDQVKGVYIMGKSATLNGQIGDILLPDTVFDQHTKNIYVINNAMKSSDFAKIFRTGSVLENQKTIAAKGTFFESSELISKWYQQGYTIIEMETGPYLNALYEFVYYNRYVENQFINLTNTPFEIGIAHYASDTPYSKAKNLGVRNLSYEGVEPTYAISLAILKKIIEKEAK